MSQCVRCRRRLKPDATSCICGWNSEKFTQSTPVPVVEEGSAHRCAAHGCPLGGTWSNSTVGEPKDWWCFVHAAVADFPLQSVTYAIRQRMGLVGEVCSQSRRLHAHEAINRGEVLTDYRRARNELLGAVYAELRGKTKPREPGEDDEALAA